MNRKLTLVLLLVLVAHALPLAESSARQSEEPPEMFSLPSTNGIDILIPGDQIDCNSSSVTITVSDFDIGVGALANPIVIAFTSDAGDSESLSLTQVGDPTTRIWAATIPVFDGPATPMNGTIDCTRFDALSFFYDDLQNGGALGVDEFHTSTALPVELLSFQIE